MMEMLEKTAAALERRHFKAAVFKTVQEAAAFILSDMPDGASVAFGGSSTCQQMGLAQLLRENGHEVLWHWEAAPAERAHADVGGARVHIIGDDILRLVLGERVAGFIGIAEDV